MPGNGAFNGGEIQSSSPFCDRRGELNPVYLSYNVTNPFYPYSWSHPPTGLNANPQLFGYPKQNREILPRKRHRDGTLP
ncbi:unnamed protein product [Diplocarpon coronariae]